MRDHRGVASSLIIIAALGILAITVVAFKYLSSNSNDELPSTNVGQETGESTSSSEISTDLGVATAAEATPEGETTPDATNPGNGNYQSDALGFKISYPDTWNTGSYNLNFGTKEKVVTKGAATVFFPGAVPTTADKLILLGTYAKAPITVIVFSQPLSKFQDITKNWQETTIDGRKTVTKTEAGNRQWFYIAKDENSTTLLLFDLKSGEDPQIFVAALAGFEIL